MKSALAQFIVENIYTLKPDQEDKSDANASLHVRMWDWAHRCHITDLEDFSCSQFTLAMKSCPWQAFAAAEIIYGDSQRRIAKSTDAPRNNFIDIMQELLYYIFKKAGSFTTSDPHVNDGFHSFLLKRNREILGRYGQIHKDFMETAIRSSHRINSYEFREDMVQVHCHNQGCDRRKRYQLSETGHSGSCAKCGQRITSRNI